MFKLKNVYNKIDKKTYVDNLSRVSSKDGFGGSFLTFDLAFSIMAFAYDDDENVLLGVAFSLSVADSTELACGGPFTCAAAAVPFACAAVAAAIASRSVRYWVCGAACESALKMPEDSAETPPVVSSSVEKPSGG
jgi:hypothetical protein